MTILRVGAVAILSLFTLLSYAATNEEMISKERAIEAALGAIGVEVLGVRHDKPDNQWDVFVKHGEKAFEVEIDATTGNVVATEEESLAEIKAELSGDLSHEGVIGDVDK
ncbi:PepSY domain-containing protein [Vibrio taketomensis]|uniref:PepSY domain-containing protein n=1 Tax=Vibrio taketomensis TaxID=2572923 RepID=UPI00138A63AA|nr:PepSY domain-containing protein [Vibrio taketomensis]